MPPSPTPFSPALLPGDAAVTGVMRQTLSGEKMTYIRYVYTPGATFPEHRHPQEQLTFVRSGNIVFTSGTQSWRLGPGEALLVPADLPHGARVEGDEEVITDNVMSPKREETLRV